ncbi:MAG: trehalose-6-phosphate synthase [Acidobacteria bacterium]|nr:trehalose-6-phosphate synthase [Acidobacteriota bacterium]
MVVTSVSQTTTVSVVTPKRRSHDLVVVANRLPVRRSRDVSGERWTTSPGGLVAALRPVLENRKSAAWVGWTGSTEEPPPAWKHEGMLLKPVALSRSDIALFYEGFANGTLWPLYHDAVRTPEYHRTWWDSYVAVNKRFAHAAAEVAAQGATVWIHDYQLQLVPAMLREQRPDLRIGFFLHIPFPPSELFVRIPWRRQIVEALLAADFIGFQASLGAHNFRRAASQVTECSTRGGVITFRDHTTRIASFPVGIDVGRIDTILADPLTGERARQIRESLGSPDVVMLGVDRLDYTKGIEVRLGAYRELLAEHRLSVENVVMMQIAEPSRSNVTGYAEIRESVEQIVGDINGNFATMGRPAVHYLHQGQPLEELVALYTAADVMLVTPLRDGMNLVAKEYVASRVNNDGVLVLSEFAGAAHELQEALLVNPHDVEGLKTMIERATLLDPDDVRRRMKRMRRVVRRNDAERWATAFIEALEAV